MAVIGERALVAYLADQLPRVTEISINYSVLAFTLVISVFAGIITGVAPAWKLSNVNVHDALKQGAGRGVETGGNRTRSVLVVCEVALSLMLLAGAGLLLRSLWKLQSVDPGFNSHNVLVAYVSVPDKKYDDPQKSSTMLAQLLQQVRSVPGVQSAAVIDALPMGGGSTQPIGIEGRPVVAMSEQPEMPLRRAGPGYFSALQIKVLRGREFNDDDVPGRPPVVVVSKSMAQQYWPNEDPIGKHLTVTFAQVGPREVIGVVDDVKVRSLDAPEDIPTVYTPMLQQQPSAPMFGGQFHAPNVWLVVRTNTTPVGVISAVTNAVHSGVPGAPVDNMQTMEDYAGATLAPQRFNLFLLGTFAGLALLLAAIGVYSLLAYSVRRRTAEIGIRLALGAQVRDVFKLVIGEGLGLVMIGVVSGLLGALALSRFLQSMVFDIPTTDIPTFFSVAVLLMLIALAASYLPARRAMRVDPMTALREE
jgi:predicted permease